MTLYSSVNYFVKYMKKIIFLIFSVFISFVIMADEQWPHKNISQAVFANNVEKRIPIDIIIGESVYLDEGEEVYVDKIYFFTNIRNLTNSKITHRWIYKDKPMADVSFAIGGPRWRVWSSKNIWHTWTGKWKVQVIVDDEEIIYEKEFIFKNKKELEENE